MIPRYDPTFHFRDLTTALRLSADEGANDALCARLRQLYGVKHVFLFNSARMALFALLKAYGRPGGVLMPAYTCIVVPEAVQCAGYRPVFADIDPCTLNVNAENLEKQWTPDMTVVLATHLMGIPCDVDSVMSFGRAHGLLVIEDAAPAVGAEIHGRLAGTIGDASIISFQATKVISSEDGGALLTNSDELAERVRPLLSAGGSPSNRWVLFLKAIARKLVLRPTVYALAQRAYRLLRRESMYDVVTPEVSDPATFLKQCSPFTSALVTVQLARLEKNLERRRCVAEIYEAGIPGNPAIRVPERVKDSKPAWIQFPILVKDKGHFYRYMQEHGIDMSWTYKYSCADSFGQAGYPESQAAAKAVLGLPTYPSLTDEQARRICAVAARYVEPASA